MLGAVLFLSASFVHVNRPSHAANTRLAVRKLSSAIRRARLPLAATSAWTTSANAESGTARAADFPQKIIRRSIPQAREFVFDEQLAPFQGDDLEIIDRWMSMGFGYFRLQGAMAFFKFCKMRFYGH
jgi:hypothetical protein